MSRQPSIGEHECQVYERAAAGSSVGVSTSGSIQSVGTLRALPQAVGRAFGPEQTAEIRRPLTDFINTYPK